ncbi:hypothetical protein FJT64_005412 [Amphibalanus amphitrite]|uniref:Uncharacterized protein n=1 Tax=Amphibalanus amphitrite TaxID=1232801 RepID=A0A6A4W556_AMPAM|nr:hypothetical protein FJT64_005412 [Amphibalanus amphitrite]
MSDTEKNTEMKPAGAAPVETSTEMLTRLLGQQLELAARRDEQLTMLLQHLHPQPSTGAGAHPTGTGASTRTEDATAAATAGARQRISLPATGMPVPRLHSSVSLMEFETWKRKFDGYCLLTHIRELSIPEQKAALIAVVDDDWARTIDFGLQMPAESDLDTIIGAMHAIQAVEVPVISAPLMRPTVEAHLLQSFRHVEMADDFSAETPLQIDILIGQDCYWSLTHQAVIRAAADATSGLRIGHLNVRSLTAHLDEVNHLLLREQLDVLCLSETWLADSVDTPNAPLLPYRAAIVLKQHH